MLPMNSCTKTHAQNDHSNPSPPLSPFNQRKIPFSQRPIFLLAVIFAPSQSLSGYFGTRSKHLFCRFRQYRIRFANMLISCFPISHVSWASPAWLSEYQTRILAPPKSATRPQYCTWTVVTPWLLCDELYPAIVDASTSLTDVYSTTGMRSGTHGAFMTWNVLIPMPFLTLRLLFSAFGFLGTRIP